MNVMKLASKMPTGVTRKLGRAGLLGKKHSPVVLFGAGVVGVVATVVLASKATLQLEEVLEKAQSELDMVEEAVGVAAEKELDYAPSAQRRDVALIRSKTAIDIAKLYAPAVFVGVASIAALTGSHIVLTRRNVALTAAYKAMETGFNKYRERVVEELGPEKDFDFRYGAVKREIVEDTDEGPVVKTIQEPLFEGGSIYARVFDKWSKRWSPVPGENAILLKNHERYLNDKLNTFGHVFLNEVYDALGLPRTPTGALVGWMKDGEGDGFIDFGIYRANDMVTADRFIEGREGQILLDFNVDEGTIYDKL